MDPEVSELHKKVVRGRMALREAIEFVDSAWDTRHPPRPGESEVWSARETAEHAITTEVWFASLAGAIAGATVPRVHGIELATPAEAIAVLGQMAIAVDEIYARLTVEHLEQETEVGRTVASVMRWSAWHLHEHAKQIVGVQ